MKTSQYRSFKLFLIVTFSVFAASLDVSKSHPSKPINILRLGKTFENSRPWNYGQAVRYPMRPGRSFQTEEEIADTRSEAASGMWFGPRLGRSSGQQRYDTVTWIALDDPARIIEGEGGRPKLMGYNWKSGNKLEPVLFESDRKLRSPQETEENFPGNAMWFGPRVGRAFPRFNVSYSLEDLKAKDGDGYYE